VLAESALDPSALGDLSDMLLDGQARASSDDGTLVGPVLRRPALGMDLPGHAVPARREPGAELA
jgi:hypothetical protein